MSATDILATIGAIGVILTTLGALLPQEWQFTAWCRRLGSDLRGGK